MKFGIEIKYGNSQNNTYRDRFIKELFEEINLSDYVFDNVESEIYILDKEVVSIKGQNLCSWDLFGENELVEIQKHNYRHHIWYAFICFLKKEITEIKLYCFDREYCEIFLKNETDYIKILKNLNKYKYNYKIYEEKEILKFLKFLANEYNYEE